MQKEIYSHRKIECTPLDENGEVCQEGDFSGSRFLELVFGLKAVQPRPPHCSKQVVWIAKLCLARCFWGICSQKCLQKLRQQFRNDLNNFISGTIHQIMNFDRLFHYKPSILGCFPILGHTKISFPPFQGFNQLQQSKKVQLDIGSGLVSRMPLLWRRPITWKRRSWMMTFPENLEGICRGNKSGLNFLKNTAFFFVEHQQWKLVDWKETFLAWKIFLFKVVALEWIDSSSSCSCILENIHSRKMKFVLKKCHFFTSLQAPSEPCVLLFRADGQLQSKATLGPCHKRGWIPWNQNLSWMSSLFLVGYFNSFNSFQETWGTTCCIPSDFFLETSTTWCHL